uniref:Uncharacterized protein n=1 Tax=Heterorhabditis bacteriophora TaxID=37862 RepID=A0A1I7W880_HETBA
MITYNHIYRKKSKGQFFIINNDI